MLGVKYFVTVQVAAQRALYSIRDYDLNVRMRPNNDIKVVKRMENVCLIEGLRD